MLEILTVYMFVYCILNFFKLCLSYMLTLWLLNWACQKLVNQYATLIWIRYEQNSIDMSIFLKWNTRCYYVFRDSNGKRWCLGLPFLTFVTFYWSSGILVCHEKQLLLILGLNYFNAGILYLCQVIFRYFFLLSSLSWKKLLVDFRYFIVFLCHFLNFYLWNQTNSFLCHLFLSVWILKKYIFIFCLHAPVKKNVYKIYYLK